MAEPVVRPSRRESIPSHPSPTILYMPPLLPLLVVGVGNAIQRDRLEILNIERLVAGRKKEARLKILAAIRDAAQEQRKKELKAAAIAKAAKRKRRAGDDSDDDDAPAPAVVLDKGAAVPPGGGLVLRKAKAGPAEKKRGKAAEKIKF